MRESHKKNTLFLGPSYPSFLPSPDRYVIAKWERERFPESSRKWLNHQQPVVGRLQKDISLENLARSSFLNYVMYTFTFSGELWVAHTGREPSEFRGSKIKIAEVKMKVAILRSENRSKVPGETCFDGKYFQKQEMETGLKYLESESVIAVKQ